MFGNGQTGGVKHGSAKIQDLSPENVVDFLDS